MAEVQFFDPKQEKQVKQRRAMAQALFKQGEQPTSTEMVSGFAVEQSPLLGLSKALSTGLAGYAEGAADKAEVADAEKKQKKLADALRIYGQDPQAAANMLMESPATSEYGMQMGIGELERQRKLEDFAASEAGKDRRAAMMADQKASDWQRNADFQREMLNTRLNAKNGGSYVDPDTGEIVQTGGQVKPLPVGALKLQMEGVDAFSAAKNAQDLSQALINKVDAGDLKLGGFSNLVSGARNYLGASTPESIAYGDMRTSLEKLRNDTLRLNKGVQTEGDAERAMNEVVASVNDPALFKANMEKLNSINERAAAIQKENVNAIRSNYGAGEYDFGTIEGSNAYAIPDITPVNTPSFSGNENVDYIDTPLPPQQEVDPAVQHLISKGMTPQAAQAYIAQKRGGGGR